MKILLVEDERLVADLLARAFVDEGHLTTVVHRGQEGLECVARNRPDAVFLDVRLPDMSGIEVLRQIRLTDAALPVVVITGHAKPEEIEKARRLGVVEVVQKPYILNELTRIIADLEDAS